MKLRENQNDEYTVFRAYNKYWIVKTALIDKLSVKLSDLRLICSVDNISINEVMNKAKIKVNSDSIIYSAFMAVLMG